MPLEIRELVIRTTVNSDRISSNNNSEGNHNIGSLNEIDQSAIVAACVDRVLSILQSQSER